MDEVATKKLHDRAIIEARSAKATLKQAHARNRELDDTIADLKAENAALRRIMSEAASKLKQLDTYNRSLRTRLEACSFAP